MHYTTINNWVDKTASPPSQPHSSSKRCAAIRTQLVLCATYLHLLSRLMCTPTSQKCVFNEPPPSAATTRKNRSRQLLCSVVAGRQHSKSLHHHERICDAWAASPLDAGSHINGFGDALLNPRFKHLICSRIQCTCKARHCRCACAWKRMRI